MKSGVYGSEQSAFLSITATEHHVQATLDFFETLLRGLKFSDKEQKQVRLALEEVIGFMTSSMLLEENQQPISLSLQPQADGLTLRINAKGLPLDLENLPSYSPTQAIDSLDEDGLGGLSLFLAHQSVDQLSFFNRGREGLEIVLMKKRQSSHIENMMEHSPRDTQSPPTPISNMVIRRATESDALDISRCAYLTYGHSYQDYIYYPERIAEMNRKGELHSVIAVNGQGEVMGHAALKLSSPSDIQGEGGVWFVNPKFRKQGLGATLHKATVELAREIGLHSMFVQAVTVHPATQIIAIQDGFKDCAINLGFSPRDTNMSAISFRDQSKMSIITQWRALTSPKPRTIELPTKYVSMIANIYDHLEIPFRVTALGERPLSTKQMRYSIDRIPLRNVATIYIEEIGDSPVKLAQQIDINRRRLCSEKLDMVYLYLNLEQPGVSEVVDYCTKQGFIFCGVKPNHFSSGDVLVLQYLNLPDDLFPSILVHSDMAKELKRFIADEYNQYH